MNKYLAHIKSKTTLNEQESWWVLESISGKTKEQLIISQNELSYQEKKQLDEWIKKLTVDHIPLTYLIGWTPFLNLKISIVPPILIPRPETEEWVDNAITSLAPHKKSIKNILDIGTGSGCIALALAKNFPQAQITALDINPTAIKLAQQNAQQNNINNVSFVKSDLFEKISNQSFDFIVSNPPYIDPKSKKNMLLQVTLWEDKKALFANKQGLEIIEKIIKQAKQHLSEKKALPYQIIIEHGYNQKNTVEKLAQQYNWNYSVHKDLFGKFRTLRLRLPR